MQPFSNVLTRCLWLLLPLLGACGSTGGINNGFAGRKNDSVEIRFNDAKSGQTLGIVNDAWLVARDYEGESSGERRTAFYSRKTSKSQAGYKVADNELMAGILEAFSLAGYPKYAREGSPGGGLRQSLQVIRPGYTSHLFSDKTDLASHTAFSKTVTAFTQIYNALPQFQAVEGKVGF